MIKNKLLLGAQVSISGGLYKAIMQGESIYCTAIQIFTKSNRQWKSKEITPQEADLFISTFKQSSLKAVVTHASYLINISSGDELISQKSKNALTDELKRCDQLEIPYLILHPGNSGNFDINDCFKNVAQIVNEIYSTNNIKAILLLENMAGQGTSIASKFEQLAKIINLIVNKSKIGICFDTCHAFSAGYDFRTKETYVTMWQEFDKIIGLDYLKVIHLNDSKKDLGSKVDRHEFLSKGKIGTKMVELLINDERFFNTIKILEVPVDNISDYVPDLKLTLSLLYNDNLKLIQNTSLELLLK